MSTWRERMPGLTKNAPCRGPEPGGVEKGVLSVRALVVGSVGLWSWLVSRDVLGIDG